MGPKKDDKKKGAQPVLGAAVVSITEDELTEAESLPHLNDFVFTNLYSFKMKRNQARLMKQIKKQFQFTSPEDPGYSEEAAVKFKTVEMAQLVGQAQHRGLINEQEAAEMSKLDPERRRDVLAQSTVESVTAFQLALRKAKRDEHHAEAEKKKAAAEADGETNEQPFTPNPEVKIEQLIYLQDFPKTAEDVKALVKHGFQQLNGVYVIEEIFNREQDDETEEVPAADLYKAEPTENPVEGEAPTEVQAPPEKKHNKQDERVIPFNEIVEINRIVKKQPEGSLLRHCDVQRIKFEGPSDPMDLPTPPEDGSEPPAIDEERKAAEFKLYDDFATTQKEMMEDLAQDLAQFKKQKAEAAAMAAPLWPIVRSPEEEARLQALEDLRASQQEALKQKQEEERQAAAAAAAPAKGGKKSAAKGTRGADQAKHAAEDEAEGAEEEEAPVEEVAPVYRSTDDDPARRRDFHEFQKIMSEMETGTATVGSIMAAMVYQIGQNTDAIQKEGLDDKYYEEKKDLSKRRLSVADKKETSRALLKANAEDRAMGDVFDSLMEKLQIEHAVQETDFRHVFSDDCVLRDPEQKSSPYMEVKNENDRIDVGAGAFRFPDGQPQGATENATLEACPIPGVNKRLGMPKTAAQTRALRESDQDQIIQFCRLPSAQTKRCLILRAAETMMQTKQPERTFSFLDRNYVEEYKDRNTMRQVLANAMNELQPEIETKYFEMDDGLLVSMFFQNPPGRLLRKQWTHPIRVFPDFPDWRNMVKENPGQLEGDRLLDIPNDNVGVLRKNTKFSFPSDNSVIRVDKTTVGQRRMGETKIIKDNFIFGVRERKEVFDQKASNEDSLRNRDAKEKQNRNCDFWLLFENGVRLSIEMQDHQEPAMDLVPRADIPAWLKAKLAREKQRQKELDEQSESQIRKSQLAADETHQQIDGAASVVGSVMESERNKDSAPANNTADGTAESKPEIAADAQDEKPQDEAEQEPAKKEEEEIIEEEDPALKNPKIEIDGQDMTMGSKLSFTFEQGLIVQIQPNGDVMQKFAQNKPLAKSTLKGNNLVQDSLPDNLIEQHRIITTNGEIIKQMGDGNFLIYFSDGTLTYSDKRKGIWYTINPVGVKRVRREKDGIVTDEVHRLKIETKIDPETGATLKIREDGVLTVEYKDSTNLIIMPDGTNILRKKRAGGEAGTVTFITKDGFVPIRQTYDPVKARAKTCIGLGGTDALMGKDLIMERTNNGKITEVLLPDNTVVQSYLEKQELEGYNNYSLNMIHIIRRADYSVVKVSQDGEVVLITANERAYLNDIGKQIEELGTKDYDYFFELFGVSTERRSGVYTANLNKGRVWTQDEEGNYFIAYANGDSVEKMSVSFDLDQMVEGIENKEPGSPRMRDGLYVEEECKFLPPPKSMAHPRLFYVKNDGSGMELFNEEQLRHMFRSNKINNADGFIKRANNVKLQNEDCISHVFITKKEKTFNASGFDISHEFPKLPQSLDLVNQTVSIPTEPVVEPITYKAVLEFKAMDPDMLEEFHSACAAYDEMKASKAKLLQDLTMTTPVVITTAAPPTEKKERMRSSDTNFMGSDGSDKASPRGMASQRGSVQNTMQSRMQTEKSNFELQKSSQKEAEDAGATTQAEDDILMDENGHQLVQHDLQLDFQQRLQLRIANDRGINLDNLMGEQYQVLKQYKSLERRQDIFNKVHDFLEGHHDEEDSRSRLSQ